MNNSLGYWTIGTQFLRLTELACAEIASSRNPHVVVSDNPLAPAEYDNETRWSDHAVGSAVLFNFFHGLELIIKGFLATEEQQANHHRLTVLLGEFDKLFPGAQLGALLHRALPTPKETSPIGHFLQTNNITIDDWFQALKYPISTRGTAYNHVSLKYGGDSTASFWGSIGGSASKIRVAAVSLARSHGFA